MLDDLTKEIKAQLYERVKSPLFGAFAFSWVAWNYRPLLAVLSKMSFQEKIAYFDTLYPTFWHWLGYCVAGPLLVAVVFLLGYPYPARWMYRYWAKQHKELKKVQQEIEDETPMTQEEAKALRKTSLEQVTQVQSQLRDMSQANRELNERLKVLTEENLRLVSEKDTFVEAAKKAEEQLTKSRSTVLTPAADHVERVTTRERVRNLFNNLPEDTKLELAGYFDEDQTSARDAFLVLVAAGDEMFAESISDVLDTNSLEIRHAVAVLLGDGLIEMTNTGAYMLTDEGVKFARKLNLTKTLPRIAF